MGLVCGLEKVTDKWGAQIVKSFVSFNGNSADSGKLKGWHI